MSNTVDEKYKDLIPIASFVPGRVDFVNIEAVLEEAGIDFIMEGSRAYQILVMPSIAKKAIDVLKKSKLANKITIYPMP